MKREKPVALTSDNAGCALESTPRAIQNGSNVYSVSLNSLWLEQLGIAEQGAATVHAVATRPVSVRNPCIIIQPAQEVGYD